MTVIQTLKQTKGLLSVAEAAQLLGSHPMTIYGWTSEGKLPHLRVGSRLKFDPAEIADWLSKRNMAA